MILHPKHLLTLLLLNYDCSINDCRIKETDHHLIENEQTIKLIICFVPLSKRGDFLSVLINFFLPRNVENQQFSPNFDSTKQFKYYKYCKSTIFHYLFIYVKFANEINPLNYLTKDKEEETCGLAK